MPGQPVHDWLDRRRGAPLTLYASAASFGAYFCMYAFRKPFTAATFDQPDLFAIDYKIVLILAQVAGYTLSKFIGIRVIAELPAGRRVVMFLGLIAAAELALVGFAVTPRPWNVAMLFLNGLPLGMVWGVVFAFLEGRRDTEVLSVCLSASFIISSGVVKGVGLYTIDAWGAPEHWMPAVTGGLFFVPMVFFAWMLAQIPRPSAADEAERVARAPMNLEQRRRWLRQLALGIGLLVGVHMLLTAMRDYRDHFGVEILADYQADSAGYLAVSELPITLGILVTLGAVMTVRDHRKAFALLHGVLIIGLLLAAGCTLALQSGQLAGRVWYIVVGLGLYLAYIPFHSILFDRLVALRGQTGNAGYLIYIADATGYLSSVLVLLYKNFAAAGATPLEFFQGLAVYGGVGGAAAVGGSLWYFLREPSHAELTAAAEASPSSR